jgi:hypothetical protein
MMLCLAGCGFAVFPVHSQTAPGPRPPIAADDPIRHCPGVRRTVPSPPPVPRTVEDDLRYANQMWKIALSLSADLRGCNDKRAEAVRRLDSQTYGESRTHETVR